MEIKKRFKCVYCDTCFNLRLEINEDWPLITGKIADGDKGQLYLHHEATRPNLSGEYEGWGHGHNAAISEEEDDVAVYYYVGYSILSTKKALFDTLFGRRPSGGD